MRGRRLALLTSLALLVAAAPAAARGRVRWTPVASGTTQNITTIEDQSPGRAWLGTAGGQLFTLDRAGRFHRAGSALPRTAHRAR